MIDANHVARRNNWAMHLGAGQACMMTRGSSLYLFTEMLANRKYHVDGASLFNVTALLL